MAVAYRTESVTDDLDELRQAIADRAIDVVTFTSGSTVDNFFAPLSPAERSAWSAAKLEGLATRSQDGARIAAHRRRVPMLHRRVVALSVLLIVACAKKEAATEPPSVATPSTAAAPTASIPRTETSATTASEAAPGTAAPGPATGAVATAEGEEPGVTVAVKELKRASGGTVSLKFVITNGSSKRLNVGYEFADPDKQVADFGSVGGVQLIDPVGKKKYFVARDSEGKCVCSRGLKDLAAGSTVNAWAKFPAPPDDVQKISVIIPHFSPMDDVLISK